jgi:hypothetical protein
VSRSGMASPQSQRQPHLARTGDRRAGRSFFGVAEFKQSIAQAFSYRLVSTFIDLLQSIEFSSSEKFIQTRHGPNMRIGLLLFRSGPQYN